MKLDVSPIIRSGALSRSDSRHVSSVVPGVEFLYADQINRFCKTNTFQRRTLNPF